MSKSFILSSAAALFLVGCASTAPTSQSPVGSGNGATTADRVSAATAGSSAWMALGTEPFWNVEVTQARINYTDADGRRMVVANPGGQAMSNGKRYVTSEIVIQTTLRPCSDGMSDRVYAETVHVEAGGRSLHGCGGAVLPPTSLVDTSWRIISINGEPIPPNGDRAATINFLDGRTNASVGCNSMNGAYSSTTTSVTIDPMIQTEMMCQGGNIMAHEAKLARILNGTLALQFNAREQLTLSAPNGDNVVLQRSH